MVKKFSTYFFLFIYETSVVEPAVSSWTDTSLGVDKVELTCSNVGKELTVFSHVVEKSRDKKQNKAGWLFTEMYDNYRMPLRHCR